MNRLERRNKDGELITLVQACEITNLGSSTVRKLADESGAVRKIGRSYRIKKSLFLNHIEKEYAE